MSLLSTLLSLLLGLSVEPQVGEFWLECTRIGDNTYVCNGGRK